VGAKSSGSQILLNTEGLEATKYPSFIPWSLFSTIHDRQGLHFEDNTNTQEAAVRWAVPFLYFAKWQDFPVFGTNEDFPKFFQEKQNSLLKDGHWISNLQTDVVVGSALAEKFDLHPGSQIELSAWGPNDQTLPAKIPVTVVGILAPVHSAYDFAMIAPLNMAWRTLQQMDLKNHSIWQARVIHSFFVDMPVQDLTGFESLINQRSIAQTIRTADEVQNLRDLLNSGASIGWIVSLLILALVCLSVAGILLTRFEAMNAQIAVLKAIGYRSRVLILWLFWEAVILGLLALIVGTLIEKILEAFIVRELDWRLAKVILIQQNQFDLWPLYIALMLALMATLTAPLTKILREDIHTQLRS
jgi:ABC-type lipoprotein release transport system permease subunit